MQRSTAVIFLLCLPFLASCAIIPVFKKPPPPAPPEAGAPSAGRGTTLSAITATRAQVLMGTMVELTAVAPTDRLAQAALTAGFQEIRRLEALLSTWIETSEISRVNQAAGQEPVSVSDDTFALLTRAVEVADYTNGGFTITLGPAVRLWNIPDAPRVPSEMELESAAPYVDARHFHLDATRRTVFLKKPGMRLDVGGIGKGAAAEKAATVMREVGATGGLVAVAGDFRVFGTRADGTAWPVGIRHPRRDGEILATLDAADEAISTSGDYERFFIKNGIRYHHILDPATLQPARLCQSVTIVAPDATWADALATGLFVMGPVQGLALIERLGFGAVIVDAQGSVFVSSRLRTRVTLIP